MILPENYQLKNGEYINIRHLSSGGQGNTYLIKNNNTNKFFVLKTFIDDNYIISELNVLLNLKHPNIVKIEDMFMERELSSCCLVIEYIKGENSWEYLKTRKILEQEEALNYIEQIGMALREVHNLKHLHRDIKPENIILRDRSRQAVLIDFGISRKFTPNQKSSMTIALTPPYAPIEQYNSIDTWRYCTDIYALATTLYIFLTGCKGLEKLLPSPKRKDKKTKADIDLIPPKQLNSKISDRVNDAILWGMAIEPSDRPQTVEEWLKELRFSASFYSGKLENPREVLIQNKDTKISSFVYPKNREKAKLIDTIDAHSDSLYEVIYHPQNKQIISASKDETIKIWNCEDFRLIKTLTQHQDAIFSLAISPNCKILASGDFDYKIKLWNLDNYELIKTLSGHAGQVLSLAICPQSETLISGSIEGYIKTWNITENRVIHNFGYRFPEDSDYQHHINPLVISPNGKHIFNGIFNNKIKVWDLENGEEIKTLMPSNQIYWKHHVNSITINPNGELLLTNNHKDIQIWDINNGNIIKTLKGHIGTIYCLKISPDGQIIASCGDDSTIKLWDLNTGELLQTLSDHKDKVYSLAFSPDGRTLVSGSRDRTIKIWQIP